DGTNSDWWGSTSWPNVPAISWDGFPSRMTAFGPGGHMEGTSFVADYQGATASDLLHVQDGTSNTLYLAHAGHYTDSSIGPNPFFLTDPPMDNGPFSNTYNVSGVDNPMNNPTWWWRNTPSLGDNWRDNPGVMYTRDASGSEWVYYYYATLYNIVRPQDHVM